MRERKVICFPVFFPFLSHCCCCRSLREMTLSVHFSSHPFFREGEKVVTRTHTVPVREEQQQESRKSLGNECDFFQSSYKAKRKTRSRVWVGLFVTRREMPLSLPSCMCDLRRCSFLGAPFVEKRILSRREGEREWKHDKVHRSTDVCTMSLLLVSLSEPTIFQKSGVLLLLGYLWRRVIIAFFLSVCAFWEFGRKKRGIVCTPNAKGNYRERRENGKLHTHL